MIYKSILCYGDSNTWGYVPSELHVKSRFTREERWTGVLQNLLGTDYYVIEEGLNSRTTNVDYNVPPDRNGKTYLSPCLYSHAPLDLVIFALGGNDYKTYFNRTSEDIRDGMAELIDIVQSSPYGPELNSAPKVLLLSPPMPLEIIETVKDENGICFMKGSVEKAKKLIGLYKELAQLKECYYLEVVDVILPSQVDGVHLDLEMHSKLAYLIAEKIKIISK